MASAADIISVPSAQLWLSASETTDLERLIKGAVDFVEEYVGQKLFPRTEQVILPFCGFSIKAYPMTIVSVTNGEAVGIAYTSIVTVNGTKIYAPSQSLVNLNVGYGVGQAPPMLVEAAYKMLTYLYENRDIYVASLPLDIQFQINKYRRNLV